MRTRLTIFCLLVSLLWSLSACDMLANDPPTTAATATATIEIPPTAELAVITATPTITPTATVIPTSTPNPTLPDWTIMVYMNADNNLEPAALVNLNEMEDGFDPAAEINVVVQIDRAVGELNEAGATWTDARRYQIAHDTDLQTVSSPIVAELGEVNMGDPAVLADFISWSTQTYPANRYALIMWDHGIGWSGISFDDTEQDKLTLSELGSALEEGLVGANVDKLDVVGFDACLMGQLEVYAAIAPYAQYAVGSEELTPGRGWDYRGLLEWLYESPTQAGDQLASGMVEQFLSYYEQNEPNSFVTMSAVDLQQVPQVIQSLNGLTAVLSNDFTFAAGTIGDARSGAEAYAHAYGEDADSYAAVDLHHFTTILGDQSLDETVKTAAEGLTSAIEQAVVKAGHGLGFKQARGIAIYFPRTAAFYQEAYATESTLSNWNRFLIDYHRTGTAELTAPQVQIANGDAVTVSIHYPAHLSFQITGRSIEEVVLLGGQYFEEGQRLLLEYDPLIPEPTYLANGERIFEWRDGLHEDFYVWNTRVTFLTDYITGDYVVMWPSYDENLRTVEGRYTPLVGGETFEARLTFDRTARDLTAVWGFTADGSPFEVRPQPGDVFQAYRFFLEDDNTITRTEGVALQFDMGGKLHYDWRPLPDGDYFIGFQAHNTAGASDTALTNLAIANAELPTGDTAYLDPYVGYQFLYPASWYRPEYRNNALFTTNISGTTTMQISLFPDLVSTSALDLKRQALQTFGGVDLLFEADLVIGNYGGLYTAYGYTDGEGNLHSGILLTFIKGNMGYVVDVDGLTAEEEETIAAVEQLIYSWTFRPTGVGLFPGNWSSVTEADFTIPQRSDFQRDTFREWVRFLASSDPRIFVAVRQEQATDTLENTLTFWSGEAARGVSGYQGGATGRFLLGGKLWLRQDFVYEDGNGQEVWGFVMVTEQSGQQLVAWVEAPAAVYNDLESTVFEVMLADLNLRN